MHISKSRKIAETKKQLTSVPSQKNIDGFFNKVKSNRSCQKTFKFEIELQGMKF